MTGIDFETVGLTPKRGNLRLVQTANGKGPRVLDAWDLAPGDLDGLLSALADRELVAHNASFEEDWMRAYGVELPQGMHDTMIAWMVIRQPDAPIAPFRLPKSLEHIARTLREEELDKEMQTSDWSLPTLTPRQWAYAAKDAEILVPPFDEMMERIDEDGLGFVYDIVRKGLASRPGGDYKMEIKRAADPTVGKLHSLFKGSGGKAEKVARRDIVDGERHTLECIKTSDSVVARVDGSGGTKSASAGSISNATNVMVGAKTADPLDDVFDGKMDFVGIDIAR